MLADIAYTRDPVGNPLDRDPHRHLAGLEDLHSTTAGPLTGVCFQTGTCPGGADPFIRWDYDGVGNRLSEQRPTGTTSYTYDQMDACSRGLDLVLLRPQRQPAHRRQPHVHVGPRRIGCAATTASGTTTTYGYDGDGKRSRPRPGTATTEDELTSGTSPGLPELVLERSRQQQPHPPLRQRARRPMFMSTTSSSNAFYYHLDPSAPCATSPTPPGQPSSPRLRALRDGPDPVRNAHQPNQVHGAVPRSNRSLPPTRAPVRHSNRPTSQRRPGWPDSQRRSGHGVRVRGQSADRGS